MLRKLVQFSIVNTCVLAIMAELYYVYAIGKQAGKIEFMKEILMAFGKKQEKEKENTNNEQ